MSSDKAHVQIYILGPFIPTIALQNSTLLLSKKKKRVFRYYNNNSALLLCHLCLCRCLLNYPKARSWCFGIRDVLTFIFCGFMFPMFYGMMEIQRWEILWGLGWEFSCLLFPPIYIWPEDFDCFAFCIFKS